MNRIAACTVIRGSGACQAFMDGIKDEEMERQNAMNRRELAIVKAELDARRGNENRLLADRQMAMRATLAKRHGLFWRIKDRVEYVWCVLWALMLEWGLIVDERAEEDDH